MLVKLKEEINMPKNIGKRGFMSSSTPDTNRIVQAVSNVFSMKKTPTPGLKAGSIMRGARAGAMARPEIYRNPNPNQNFRKPKVMGGAVPKSPMATPTSRTNPIRQSIYSKLQSMF